MTDISVGVVIKNKKVLLIKRSMREGNLSWQFPAGKILFNEKAEDAVIREVFEETNINCIPFLNLGEKQLNEDITAHYFICHFESGHIRPNFHEVKKAKWKSISEARTLITSDLYEPISDYLKEIELEAQHLSNV